MPLWSLSFSTTHLSQCRGVHFHGEFERRYVLVKTILTRCLEQAVPSRNHASFLPSERRVHFYGNCEFGQDGYQRSEVLIHLSESSQNWFFNVRLGSLFLFSPTERALADQFATPLCSIGSASLRQRYKKLSVGVCTRCMRSSFR
jgi:hypothetical protein